MGVAGSGTAVRQWSLRTSAGTLAGNTTPGPIMARETATTKVDVGGLDCSGVDAAQQLSASPCVIS